MRAATIRDGEVVVAEHPDPQPGAGEVLVKRARGRAQRRRHPPARGPLPGAARARRPTSPGSSSPARWWRAVPAPAVHRGRPRDGDRRRRRAGRAGGRPRAPAHARARRPGLAEAGGLPEVFTTAHDALFTQGGLRPGERLLVHGAAGGVGTAGVQLGRAAGAHVTATVRNPEPPRRRRRARRRRGPRPEGFEEHGPFDVVLELVGAPNMAGDLAGAGHRRADRRHRRRRRRKAELNLRALMGKRATCAPRRCARARSRRRRSPRARWSARCCRCFEPARSACRSPRPSRSTRPPRPTSASPPAASSARSSW